MGTIAQRWKIEAVYIKLAVYVAGGVVRAVCVSFHEAEWPLAYPYRKAG